MKAYVLELQKVNGKHNVVLLCLENGLRQTVSVNQLYGLLRGRKIILCNAYVTKDGQVRHKSGTREYKVNEISETKTKNARNEINLDLYRNSKVYDGKTRKFGVTINSNDYIVKLPKHEGDLSVICEHVASSFINNLGYSAHQTKLIKYKGSVVVLMKDFTSDSHYLRSFKDTGQSSEDTDLVGKEYSYKDVLHLIDKHTKISKQFKHEVKLYFWRMFVLDAILANRDRHHGNWGYLSSKDGYKFAPIYDNGACLFPDVGKTIENYKVNRGSFLSERAERFPASLLMMYSKEERRYKRTNYYQIIGHFKNSELNTVLKEFRKLTIDDICSAIKSAVSSPLIPDIYKKFYVDIVQVRYLHIVLRLPLEEAVRRVIYAT